MPRLVIITLLSASFLTLGTPLCCVIGDSCCQQASEQSEPVKEPACPHCPAESETDPTPSTCDCANHAVDLTLGETAPESPSDLVGITATLERDATASTIVIAHGETTAPPRAHAALSLPLLL